MYTPTNYYNPYMSQIQQQPQMQIPAQNNLYNQSPYMSQNNNQLLQPTCINGKIVDSEDILKVTEIPMGGFGVFPKADFNEIYLKYWKDNGTTNGYKSLNRWDNDDGYLWESDMPRDMRKTHMEDTPNSKWEGRSPAARRTYMESKEMHKDTKEQMQKLEDYMKELSTDITDMIKDATPQEKTTLKQKLNTLVTMIHE